MSKAISKPPADGDHPAAESTPAANGQAEATFADARSMYAAALTRLAADDLRDAAEKAWCATLRATDGLILARTGQAPKKSPETTGTLRRLSGSDPDIDRLRHRYFTAQGALHGDCFYLGHCEPVDDTKHLIRETIDYIDEAQRLALVPPA